MPDAEITNYPDILGYITDGSRYIVSAAQVALGVRPRVVRTGRLFEAILLIQNMSDGDIDVTATLQLPETDLKKKPKRFVAKSERLLVGLRPAEVGYVTLPITCLPDTAIGDGYKLAMTVDVKALKKADRVRLPEGGGAVDLNLLSPGTVDELAALKKAAYSTVRRGMFGTTTLEATFGVLSAGGVGQIADLTPGWVTLWTLSDHRDDRLTLSRHADLIYTKLLPALRREKTVNALYKTTQQRFERSGYSVYPIEAHYIAKLLAAVLEMANPTENVFDHLADETLNIAHLLKRGTSLKGTLPLPSWFRGMLRAVEFNPAAAESPISALTSTLYDDLLKDACRLAFKMMARVTGEKIGDEADVEEYISALIARLQAPDTVLRFNDVYMPLVIGGVILFDRACLPSEKLGDSLNEIGRALVGRYPEIGTEDRATYTVVEKVIERARQKYGYQV
jgi:hypothetical protein